MKNELNKLFNNKPFNENQILDEMNYLSDIETVIKSLRSKYSNDNTFKSYIIVNVLIPPRRLENIFIRITDETDTDKLKT